MPDSVNARLVLEVSDGFWGNLVAHTITKETGKHELGTEAHGADGAVLDNQALVGGEKSLQWGDDLAQVRLVAGVVVGPLGVKDVVQSDKPLCLVHSSTPHTAKLLHVGADAEKETQVHAEGTDVGAGFAADPEDTQVAVIIKLDELALVDGTDTKLALDGRNQGRALEQSTSERLESLGEGSLATRDLVVQADDADVLLSGTLLGLDEARGTVDADDETSRHLGIEGSAVARLLNTIKLLSIS